MVPRHCAEKRSGRLWLVAPKRRFVALLLLALASLFSALTLRAQQTADDRFELRGSVVNAVTSAPIGNVLVTLNGPISAQQLSGADGTFTFANLPRGRYQLSVNKPGYFDEHESSGGWAAELSSGNGDVTLQMTPEGVIYGTVEGENAQPVEGVQVQVEAWRVIDSVKQLQPMGNATTDDEGNFRIAELRPGTYYLKFLPDNARGWRTYSALNRNKHEQVGYPPQFYPAGVEEASATPIRIQEGSQIQINQTLKTQKLFEVAGIVRGTTPGKWVNFRLLEPHGGGLAKDVRFDDKTGEFQIEKVPEGAYLLVAQAQDPSEDDSQGATQPLTAVLPIQVNHDLSGLFLALSRGISIPVEVDDEIASQAQEVHPVHLRLLSKDFPQSSRALMLPPRPNDRHASRQFENVLPGTYDVQAWPQAGGYIASLRCGSVDLLKDELIIASGASVPPIEVQLRNDGAEINVQAVENGRPTPATVVIFSEEYPKLSFLQVAGYGGRVALSNARPGPYKVIAVKAQREVEFHDPAVIEKYAAQAKEVTLRPGDKASIQVEVQTASQEQD